MANLETLFIQIEGNADKAKGGIDSLITSLSSLGTIVDDICRKFVGLTQAIQSVSRVGNVKLPSFSNIPKAAGLTQSQTGGGSVPENVGKATQEIEKANNATHKWGQTFNQIGRIAKTLVIRTALRALMKAFSASWTAAYNYSKAMGGEFAQNVEKLRGAITGTATKLVSTFTPALNAVTPIINVVATGIAYLCDVLQFMMSLLGISSEMFSASADSIQEYADATGKGSKGAKGMLAAFDELNVIQSGGGGTSPTGGGVDMSYLTDAISAEMARLQVIVGESMIALGLILAFTGHIPLGVGMIAIGASAIVKTLVNDWGKLTNDVKGEIAVIMAAAGAAMLALGAILAFSGANIPLGIALIAVGAANIATAASLAWNLDDTVKGKIAVISGAIGGALLAVGALLAFSGANIPLGIGIMIAGAASLASAVALTWSMDSTISQKIGVVTAAVGGAFLALGAIFAFSGAGVGLGIGMMLIGAASLATSVATAWDTLPTEVQNTISTVGAIVGGALLVLGAILCFSGAGIPLGIGLILAGSASLASAVSLNWGSIVANIKSAFSDVTSWLKGEWDSVADAVRGAWNAVSSWEKKGEAEKVKTAWNVALPFVKDGWDSIKTSISNAWAWVEKWIGAKWNDLKSGWTNIETNITNVWSNIGSAVSLAWENVKSWVGAKWSDMSRTWDNIKESFQLTWKAVQNAVSGAWDKVKDWTGAKWDSFKTGWEDIKSNLSAAWGAVEASVSSAWTLIKRVAAAGWSSFGQAWDEVKERLVNRWETIEGAVTTAWNAVKTWTNATWKGVKGSWDSIKDEFVKRWGAIETAAIGAWSYVEKWAGATWDSVKGGWDDIKNKFVSAWNGVKDGVTSAWTSVRTWIDSTWSNRFKSKWEKIKTNMANIWSGKDSIKTAVNTAWNALKDWFSTGVGSAFSKITNTWRKLATWFKTNVTEPIENAFKTAINWIIDKINIVIGAFNSVGNFNTPEISILGHTVLPSIPVHLWTIAKIQPLATGGFPNAGDLFLANESGAELVGSMNGKTTVANQEQIIEGIRRGVSDANSEQNVLLRQQNELLRGILQKEFKLGASSAFGRIAKQSLDMYGTVTGG